MREKNIKRINSIYIGQNDLAYLHYVSYHKDLFDSFSEHANGKLLDIGCGNKPYMDVLKQYTTAYFGCDIIQSNEDVVDLICPANNIPLESDTFDTVISTQTIEHVEDHQGLVNEAYRLLKNNGCFILSGPMYWPLHEEPYDFFRFTKYGFKYLLESAGFTTIAIKSNGGKWSVAGQAFLHALYPQVYGIRGFKGKLIRGLLRMIGDIKTINKFFLYMDSKGTDHGNTMNYVIVAKKICN